MEKKEMLIEDIAHEESYMKELIEQGVPFKKILSNPKFRGRGKKIMSNLQRKEKRLYEMYEKEEITTYLDIGKVYLTLNAVPYYDKKYQGSISDLELNKKFQLRDKLNERIEELKSGNLQLKEEKQLSILGEIKEFEKENPIVIKIRSYLKAKNDYIRLNSGAITKHDIMMLLNKNGLTIRDLSDNKELYCEYANLIKKLDAALLNDRINALVEEVNEIESEIISRNIKLVKTFIEDTYGDLLVEQDDLFQICYIGLSKAVKAFDYTYGFKISTLAYKYMDIEVKRNFKSLTGYSWEAYWKNIAINRLINSTKTDDGTCETVATLSDAGLLDLPRESAEYYAKYPSIYTMSELGLYEDDVKTDIDDDSNAIIDDVNPKVGPEPSIEVIDNSLRDALLEAMGTLTEKEKTVLLYRFGLIDGYTRTLEEVGKIFHVTRERIRQIEGRALRKLRRPKHSKKLKLYLD